MSALAAHLRRERDRVRELARLPQLESGMVEGDTVRVGVVVVTPGGKADRARAADRPLQGG